MKNKIEFRRDWFKVLACDSHTWPIMGCEECWDKITARLELDQSVDFEQALKMHNDGRFSKN